MPFSSKYFGHLYILCYLHSFLSSHIYYSVKYFPWMDYLSAIDLGSWWGSIGSAYRMLFRRTNDPPKLCYIRRTPLISTSTPAYSLHYRIPASTKVYGASTLPPGIHQLVSFSWITRYLPLVGFLQTIIEMPKALILCCYGCIVSFCIY